MGSIIIFAAPSGSGKSTIINYLMNQNLNLKFSISATSRPPRGNEKDGVEYYFLSPQQFKEKINNGEFLEYCEVYSDKFYGTLKSEVDRILKLNQNVVLDVDVIGAKNIKQIYGEQALTLFIQPPSLDELKKRLEERGTETTEAITYRLNRASYELNEAKHFDFCIINDNLSKAQDECLNIIKAFITK